MAKWISIIKNQYFSLLDKRTFGARALVIQDEQILLVKHTYTPGWYTIGGGVKRGETPRDAAARELDEEVGIQALQLTLFNVYHSRNEKRDDYIAFYICQAFEEQDKQSLTEIKEKKWFPLAALPDDITPATRRRIEEFTGLIPICDDW